MRIVVMTLIAFFLIIQMVFRFGADSLYDTAYIGRQYKLEEFPSSITPQTKIMIGDSTSMTAFIPEKVGEEWLNFSMSCANFYENYIFIKRLIDEKRLPKTIFLSLHLKSIINTENCFRDITLATNLFSVRELWEFYSLPHVESYYIPTPVLKKLHLPPVADLILAKMYLLPEQKEYLRTAFSESPRVDNEEAMKFQKKNKGQFLSLKLGMKPITQVGSEKENLFKVPQIGEHFLEKMLNELSAKGVRVVFVHPPYTNYYKKLFESSSILKDEELYFQKISKKYPLFKYRSEILYMPDDHFIDIGHTSPKGAEAYSSWFKKSYSDEK